MPMDVISLSEWLAAHAAEYATVEEAITAGNLALQTGGPGLAGTALRVVGGAGSSAVDAAVTAENIIDFAAAQQAAATGAEVSTSAIGAVQTASGGAKLTGVLGVELGTVAAAVAPLLGVALGVDLYRSNPDFWTKMSQKLIPFCWPGDTRIPSWAEVFENTWVTTIPKKVYEAIKELFDEEGIAQPDPQIAGQLEIAEQIEGLVGSVPVFTYNPYMLYQIHSHYWFYYVGYNAAKEYLPCENAITINGDNYWFSIQLAADDAQRTVAWEYLTREPNIPPLPAIGVPASPWRRPSYDNPLSGIEIYTKDGKTVRYILDYNTTPIYSYSNMPSDWFTVSRGFPIFGSGAYNPVIDSWFKLSGGTISLTEIGKAAIKELAWSLKYGTVTPGETKYYPTGTQQWTGNTPTEIPLGKPAYVSPTETEPTIEVAFPPEVVPGPEPEPTPTPEEIPNPSSPDPEEFPDPDKVKDPEKQVDPYIIPSPVPWEDYVPTPQPNPEPNLDPAEPLPPTQTVNPLPFDIVPYPDGIVPFPSMPDTPVPFATNVGLITVYHPTADQLYNFARWLWVTYQDAEIQKIWNNPFDGVITLFELYCTPTDIGKRNIHSGFLDSGINSAVISRYTEINCGTMSVPEYYGNYLDYSPYTRAYIYLPFIGVQELNADDIVGHAVNVTYRIDEYNGSCIAMITVAKVTEVNGKQEKYSNIMYQFSGNCSVELPLAGGSQASIKAGMMTANAYQQAAQVTALGQALGGVASILSTNPLGGLIGGLGGAASSLAYGQAQALSNMLSGKSIVAHSGGFGSSHGALGVKNPFITVVRPKQIRVPNYNELYGYPAHKQVIVGNCTGFLRCLEVHVISATATDDEKSLIESMMKSGVYVTE